MKVNMDIKNLRKNGKVSFFIASLIELFIAYESLCPMITVDENQWLYVSSMMPQVLATLLGLSFAGYQFYGNMLQNMIAQDYTIKDSVKYGKKSVFDNIKFISILTGVNIILSVISILLFNTYHCRMLQNAANIIFYNSVVLLGYIVYYFIKLVLRLTNPKFLEISSDEGVESENIIQNMKNEKMDCREDLYQYGVFMREFGELENLLRKASNNIAKKIMYTYIIRG